MTDQNMYTMITHDIGVKKDDAMYCNWIITRVFEPEKSSIHLTNEEIAELKAFLNKHPEIKILKKISDDDRNKIDVFLKQPSDIDLKIHGRIVNIYESYDGLYGIKIDEKEFDPEKFNINSEGLEKAIQVIEREINK